MKPVTIDNLNIKDHVRWAKDQEWLDPTYTREVSLVSHHPEVLWNSTVVTSKWEELFEWQKRNVSWANFEAPEKYHMVSKRLFSYRLFPSIYWKEEEEGSEDQENEQEKREDEREQEGSNLMKEVLNLEKFPNQPMPLFERDKSTIISLLESIKFLNTLLAQINARKLQYQKG
ncbi:MAG: DUF5399 family protein [Rhabdochlamydiaceae bacterium]|nr:DUF5399 family protein [Rhabdochlamydiaceae bacterium]